MTGRRLLLLCGRRRPQVSGRMRIDGLESRVTIARDRWGVPHISANSSLDAWFGLGFCHAQDRAFQLEVLARAGRGTLAALLGSPAVPIDRLSRRLGFSRLADDQLPMLDLDIRAAIEAYVRGVNTGLGRTPRPHELVLLRARPGAWQAQDVLAFLALESFALGGNWDVELARLRVLVEDGPEAVTAVDPVAAPWLPVSAPLGEAAGPALGRLAEDLALLSGVVAAGGGSNVWAISGARTASGAPLLANDPHLAPTLPAPWYLAHLRTPQWEVAGASFVGGPAFPTGHNGHAAWGITAGLSDGSDLFLEQISPDGRAVRDGDGWQPCRVIREEIAVRGGGPVVEEVLVTPRGPIVSPIVDGASHALSLSAVWLRPQPVRGLLEATAARSFEAFRRPFAAWAGPALGIAYADRAGHIGWQLVGQVPRRRRGNGTIPLPGWDPANGWEDEPVPFGELPCEHDPSAGFVASANNQPRRDGGRAFLGIDWLDGYRVARIAAELAARDDWDGQACAALQLDVASLPFHELRELLALLPATSPAESRGVALLRGWDGGVTATSAAATVFQLLLAELSARVAEAKAPRGWRWSLGAGFGSAIPRTLLSARNVSPLVRKLLEEADARPDPLQPAAVAEALASVVERLEHDRGPDPAAWAWGRLRPLTLLHPLGQRPPLDRIFNLGPLPIGGDANTVAQAGVQPLDPFGNPTAIPNLRTVMELGDPERNRYVIAGGQSGNPLSEHYDDLLALWQRGEGVPIPWSPQAMAAATVTTLTLAPEPEGGAG